MQSEQIQIQVETQYIKSQSQPENNKYVFAYTITINNQGDDTVQLLHRHWLITDADGKKTEVEGPGVVGEQPEITPGESFSYTSGTVLNTPIGVMEGHYTLQVADSDLIQATIPTFRLSVPNILH
ncbi:Co2+/Mg2+ efflux protein ApaG [Motilimonas pumila]|uniref:Protein ApaG n=1 Tax=Motilimonas pumila TaxID=2303987 RepID=A0A418YAA3_9GAMM|nr:Co2+/Mg2+ efflux protein ApaG [Motilimonas pumila]RJG39472.1 Co2+/Mg2+ efflux protein ApaG [Motilimonas pumila]